MRMFLTGAALLLVGAALVAGAAGIIGALAGSAFAYQLDEEVLRKVFAIVLVILAIRMLYKAINLQRASVAPDGGGDGP